MAAMTFPSQDPEVGRLLTAIARMAGEDRAQQQKLDYLRHLPSGTIVDVGCGEGVMLDVLRAAGRTCIGIDQDAVATSAVEARGHRVLLGDALPQLHALQRDGAMLDGAVLLHVIEHCEPPRALALLQAIAAVLRPGAVLVVATPNCRSYLVHSETFWLDPTHVRPYPRALLERMVEATGFRVTAAYVDPLTRPRRSLLRAAVARVRSWLSGVDKSGPMDLVVVCQRQ